ncbi:ROK family protein [Brevibacterium zhoupengii]|uniref:ROK family protein n=1 Tax=Brevibacterium zhoupengii TaxID=2898795 RepID=UPI001E283C6C|nr:ROK family protein [Brevibacterium zhoupengii]
MTSAPVVAVDVGGTKIRAGSVIDGVVDHLREVPTPAAAGARAILDSIAEVAREVIRDTEVSTAAGSTPAWHIGIGSAGVIDPDTGSVVSATDSLTGWAGTALTAEITARLGVEARAVNDVHAHALGEALAGAARGTQISLLVAAGTGIGGGFITENRLLTGRRAAAGHIGHLPVAAAQGLPCPCGGRGHLEAIASGPAVLSAYQRAVGEHGPGGLRVTTTRELAELADTGDASAQRAFEQAGRALGSALGGVANVLSPEVIVIGGGLSGAGELWWAPLREAFAAELIPAARGLSVRPAQLGQDAALIGAASLWSKSRGSTDGTTMTSSEESQGC